MVPSARTIRTIGSREKLRHKKFHLNRRKNFFTVRVTAH